MRIWSLHPKYLDSKGLVALWREGLLAKKVLEGKTKGYRNHPQLIRFREQSKPIEAISFYLGEVLKESLKRGYSFDASKVKSRLRVAKIPVTDEQLAHEVGHLKGKLKKRDKQRYIQLSRAKRILPHTIFKKTKGAVEEWEKLYDKELA